MQYRVYFSLTSGYFYTEWFDTLQEADDFVIGADEAAIPVHYIEDSNHIIV